MTATHMEHVLQHGFVLGELTKLIRSRPTLNDAKLWRIEFIQERGTGKRYARVFLQPVSATDPRLVFEVRDRDRLESTALWESGTRARLLEAWQAADHPPKTPPPAPPAEDFPQTTEELREALRSPNPPPESEKTPEAPVATAPKPSPARPMRARAGRGTKSA